MLRGSFGTVHLLSLLIGAGIISGVYPKQGAEQSFAFVVSGCRYGAGSQYGAGRLSAMLGHFFLLLFPHLLEFGIPILLFRLGLVKKDVKCIASTLLITLCVYTLIHWANVSLNSYFTAEQITKPAV
ncbi:MAG: hypothetical protein IJN04_03950 [Clostridia bacterium]|nr:hypothetical protein [Clostridia bacterium]